MKQSLEVEGVDHSYLFHLMKSWCHLSNCDKGHKSNTSKHPNCCKSKNYQLVYNTKLHYQRYHYRSQYWYRSKKSYLDMLALRRWHKTHSKYSYRYLDNSSNCCNDPTYHSNHTLTIHHILKSRKLASRTRHSDMSLPHKDHKAYNHIQDTFFPNTSGRCHTLPMYYSNC